MSLRITTPQSPVVWIWRAPTWSRVAFSTVGVLLVVGGLWSSVAEEHAPSWYPAALGVALVVRTLRPMLTLTADALYVRGVVLTRVIPIEQVSAVEGRGSSIIVRWSEGRATEATATGGQADALVGPDGNGLWHTMPALVLATRDAYLNRHGLTAPTGTRVAG